MNSIHKRGEIATIITLGALIIIGVSAVISSTFLPKKNTSQTKATETAGSCNDLESRRTGGSPPGAIEGTDKADIAPSACNIVCCEFNDQCERGKRCMLSNGYCKSGFSCIVDPNDQDGTAQRCPIPGQTTKGEVCSDLTKCNKDGSCDPACCDPGKVNSSCPKSGEKCIISNAYCQSGASCGIPATEAPAPTEPSTPTPKPSVSSPSPTPSAAPSTPTPTTKAIPPSPTPGLSTGLINCSAKVSGTITGCKFLFCETKNISDYIKDSMTMCVPANDCTADKCKAIVMQKAQAEAEKQGAKIKDNTISCAVNKLDACSTPSNLGSNGQLDGQMISLVNNFKPDSRKISVHFTSTISHQNSCTENQAVKRLIFNCGAESYSTDVTYRGNFYTKDFDINIPVSAIVSTTQVCYPTFKYVNGDMVAGEEQVVNISEKDVEIKSKIDSDCQA